MKKSLVLTLFSLLLAGFCSAAGLNNFTGSTTIKLKGYLGDSMMEKLSSGEPLRITKDNPHGFLSRLIFVDPWYNGSYGLKDKDLSVSFNPKSQKYSYSDKALGNLFFTMGSLEDDEDYEECEPDKASIKCSGKLQNLHDLDLYEYPIGLHDGLPESDDLCGWTYVMEKKGKNLVFSKKEKGASVKITVNAKSIISASLKLGGEYVEPRIDYEYEPAPPDPGDDDEE
ncbi:hypothetical protein J6U78_00765 [bacterium]|nr:hypothetical protein [bacterium]